MFSFHVMAAALGWIGTAMLVLAYWLVSEDKVTGDSVPYQALNIAGAIGLGLAALDGKVWSAVALNVFWAAIGVSVLIKAGLAQSKRQPASENE